MALNVLSAGAAKAVVTSVAKEAGLAIGGAFGAVGAMKVQFQFPPAPTVVVPSGVVPPLGMMLMVSPASPVPLRRVPVPVVNTGAPGAIVSVVIAVMPEALLVLPAASVAMTVIFGAPFARGGAGGEADTARRAAGRWKSETRRFQISGSTASTSMRSGGPITFTTTCSWRRASSPTSTSSRTRTT